MTRTPRKTLGLAVQDGKILAAEVRISGARRLISRTASFVYPPGVELNDPQALGKAFTQFLRAEQFTAKHVVIGLPVQWLITKEQAVPPADQAALDSLLRIQAERAFSHDGKDLAIDYACQDETEALTSVLLFAAMQQKVDQIKAVAEAAGLTVRCVTASATTLALASAAGSNAHADLVVQLIPGSVELAIRDEQQFRTVRHLRVAIREDQEGAGEGPPVWLETLTSELRREMATAAGEAGAVESGRLVVWDGVGLRSDAIDRMAERLSLRASDNRSLSALAEVNGAVSSAPGTCQFAAAVALARSAADPQLVAVDFLHSRLAPPRKTWFDRRARLATIGAAAVVVVLGAMGLDWYGKSQAVGILERDIESLAPTVAAAELLIKKVNTASGWYDARPPCLECLLHVTRAFPEDGRIWATQLSLADDMRGVLSGRATEDRAVLEVFKGLQESPAFSEVKLHGGIKYPQKTSREQHLVFSIGFRFREER